MKKRARKKEKKTTSSCGAEKKQTLYKSIHMVLGQMEKNI